MSIFSTPYAHIAVCIALFGEGCSENHFACRLLLALSHSRWLLLTALFGPVSLGLALGSPAVLIAVKRYTKQVRMLFSGTTPWFEHFPSLLCSLYARFHLFRHIVLPLNPISSPRPSLLVCGCTMQTPRSARFRFHQVTSEVDTDERQTAIMACRATAALRMQCSMQP